MSLATVAWTCLYLWRGLIGHYSLDTNAYDLSVFDYALWSLVNGEHATVPFLGHSVFSHHCMPILYPLAGAYAIWQTSEFLIVLQILIVASAGLMLYRVLRTMDLPGHLAVSIALVFLFARRTHSATAGLFYPESLQSLLTLGLVLAFRRSRWVFWPTALLLLATKEDAAIYTGAFAALQVWLDVNRRRAGKLLLVSVVWLFVALVLAIPLSRRTDGLPPANPLLEARYGSAGGEFDTVQLARRLFSVSTLGTLKNLAVTTGGLPVFGALWLVPAVPGMVLNMSSSPGTMQAGMSQHYAWPLLPWLFLALAAGAGRLYARWPTAATVWVSLLLISTLADNPALQRMFRTRLDPQARLVLEQVPRLANETVLAQPNLIPHLPHVQKMFALGSTTHPPHEADVVLITFVGNLWPFAQAELEGVVASYRADPAYAEATSGPLYVFVRRRSARLEGP